MIEQRYMTDVHEDRLVFWAFHAPCAASELTDETDGVATIASREEPGDTWGPPKRMSEGTVPYGIWRAVVENDGFVYSEIVHADADRVEA